jgi:hypothetical protein
MVVFIIIIKKIFHTFISIYLYLYIYIKIKIEDDVNLEG